MAFIVFDRVKEYTNTSGDGAISLLGSEGAYLTFAQVCQESDTFHYCIAERDGVDWEVGLGRYESDNTITRLVVIASSNSGQLVEFAISAKDVFMTFSANLLSLLTELQPSSFIGRDTGAGVGEIQQLTAADVKNILNITASDISGLVSNEINNRAVLDGNGAILVPDYDEDLVAIYNTAKQ